MGYTLVIDNYDSFTWNVYADLAVLGGNPLVVRNDKITLPEIEAMYDKGEIDRVVISPGPGHPRTDSGISREVITWAMGRVPLLGVCMGLECLVDVLGGEVSHAFVCGQRGAFVLVGLYAREWLDCSVPPHTVFTTWCSLEGTNRCFVIVVSARPTRFAIIAADSRSHTPARSSTARPRSSSTTRWALSTTFPLSSHRFATTRSPPSSSPSLPFSR